MLLVDSVEYNSKRFPNRKAIVCDGKEITYLQLNKEINRLAIFLYKLGIRKGNTVGILLPNCLEFTSCILAPQKIGSISIPLNPEYNTEELEYILKKCKFGVLIVTPSVLKILKKVFKKNSRLKTNIILHKADTKEKDREKYQSLERILKTKVKKTKIYSSGPKDDAMCLFTSGTTGLPKGLLMTHGQIAVRCMGYPQNYKVSSALYHIESVVKKTKNNLFYQLGGLYHSGKLFTFIPRLFRGFTLYIDSKFEPQKVLDRLSKEKINFFSANPFHFGVMANWDLGDIPKLPHLKKCLTTGNKLYPEIAEKFKKRFDIDFIEFYGTSETGGISNNGIPRNHVKIKIVDRSGKKVGKNNFGEIVVKKFRVTKSYFDDPELTSKAFKGKWFYTGDIGKIDSRGKIHIRDRMQNTMTIDNKIVYFDEIKNVLLWHPKVNRAMIYEEEGKLKCKVSVKEKCSEEYLLHHCKQKLEPHKVPIGLEISPAIPPDWIDDMEPSEYRALPKSIKDFIKFASTQI